MTKFDKLNFISETPLQEMANLRRALDAKPRLFVKRDDLTEVGLGGNKNRKLDYLMADALARGVDAVVTWGGVQSNHCRQTAAYAALLGMDCHIVANGAPVEISQGNALVYRLFGAKIHFESEQDKCPDLCEELAAKLARIGKKPFVIPLGGSSPLGAVGYIDCMEELAAQLKAASARAEHIFCASGSSGTQAGLEIGAKLHLPECKINGVAVSRVRTEQAPKIARCANDTAALIGADLHFKPEDICIHDEFFGTGYAIPTKSGLEAIRLVGRTQAILLDPIYTAKAMDAMITLLKSGVLDGSEAVVFLHTGGHPAVFDYAGHFKEEK